MERANKTCGVLLRYIRHSPDDTNRHSSVHIDNVLSAFTFCTPERNDRLFQWHCAMIGWSRWRSSQQTLLYAVFFTLGMVYYFLTNAWLGMCLVLHLRSLCHLCVEAVSTSKSKISSQERCSIPVYTCRFPKQKPEQTIAWIFCSTGVKPFFSNASCAVRTKIVIYSLSYPICLEGESTIFWEAITADVWPIRHSTALFRKWRENRALHAEASFGELVHR